MNHRLAAGARTKLDLPARVATNGKSFLASLRNLSATGAGVFCPIELDVNMRVTISWERFEVSAEVAWTKSGLHGLHFDVQIPPELIAASLRLASCPRWTDDCNDKMICSSARLTDHRWPASVPVRG